MSQSEVLVHLITAVSAIFDWVDSAIGHVPSADRVKAYQAIDTLLSSIEQLMDNQGDSK